jgi:hypothetical protein
MPDDPTWDAPCYLKGTDNCDYGVSLLLLSYEYSLLSSHIAYCRLNADVHSYSRLVLTRRSSSHKRPANTTLVSSGPDVLCE